MATKVYMEALSPTMEEGRLITWLKNEGDEVADGDVLAEVETDKATMELAARGSGVLRKRLLGEGETASVGVIIGVIAAADEDISAIEAAAGGGGGAAAAAPANEAEAKGAAVESEGPAAEEKGAPAAAPAAPAAAAADGDRVKASPLARRLAEEGGLSLGDIE